jgi:hypothetical protein
MGAVESQRMPHSTSNCMIPCHSAFRHLPVSVHQGNLTAGVLGTHLGLRPTLWVAAVGFLVSLALALGQTPLPRLRSMPIGPDADGAHERVSPLTAPSRRGGIVL